MLFRFGATFRAVDEEEMPTDDSCVHVHEKDEKDFLGHAEHNYTYSLFAFPAEDNFAGVKYPLSWIEKVQEGYFHDVAIVP